MAKFKFSLEKVLNHRHIQVDLAKRDYTLAQDFLNDEREILRNMEQLKADSLQRRSEVVQSSQSWTHEVHQINQYLIGQDVRIKNQNLRLLDIEKQVEALLEILRNANREAKIIDKLKEKKFEDFKREQERKEQNELDELSVLRFSRNENPVKGSHEDGI